MAKKKAPAQENNSLKKVFAFLSIVCVLLVTSFIFRLVYVIKNSQFDRIHRFTVAVISSQTKADVISFNPSDRTVILIALHGNRRDVTPGKILGIPVNGTISLHKIANGNTTAADLLLTALLSRGNQKEGLTVFDILQLYMFSKTVRPSDFSYITIPVTETPAGIDKKVSILLNDPAIQDEQISIEIVNGTGIEGLGKRLARVIQNSGGNVIAISNTNTVEKQSKMYVFGKTYIYGKKVTDTITIPCGADGEERYRRDQDRDRLRRNTTEGFLDKIYT